MADKVSYLAACKTAYDEALALNGQSSVDAQFAAKDQQLIALQALLDAAKADAAVLDQADASADAARAKLHTDLGG